MEIRGSTAEEEQLPEPSLSAAKQLLMSRLLSTNAKTMLSTNATNTRHFVNGQDYTEVTIDTH